MTILYITPKACPRPRFSRFSGAYMPTEYKKFQKDLESLLKIANIPKRDYTGLDINFFIPYPKSTAKKHLIDKFPYRKKPDVDNYIKSVMDSMEKVGILENDSQIYKIFCRKLYTTGTPRIEFNLYEDE